MNPDIYEKNNPTSKVIKLCFENPFIIIANQIDISLIRIKIHILVDMAKGNIYLILISKKKMDDAFPEP